MRGIANWLKFILPVLAASFAMMSATPVTAQTTIEKLAEVRFGNHGGTGYVDYVLPAGNDRTIIVGHAYLPDPKRSGSLLTTMTYTEIKGDGTVLAEKTFGRSPALSLRGAARGDGVTYVYGFNGPSLFTDNPDYWVAAIADGGRMVWRKPVDETKIGDVDLFVEPSGRLVMAGNVTQSEEVGILPWSADGVIGAPRIFGTVARGDGTYPSLLVRDSGDGGTELLYARSNDSEVRLDRFVADSAANWTARTPWSEQRNPRAVRPYSVDFEVLSDRTVMLIPKSSMSYIDQKTNTAKMKDVNHWIVAVHTDGTPRLEHIDNRYDEELVSIDRQQDGSLTMHATSRDVAKITTAAYARVVDKVSYAAKLTLENGQRVRKKGALYMYLFDHIDTSDPANPVMFGTKLDKKIGRKNGFSAVPVKYIFFGTQETYAATSFGVFESIKDTRRLANGDIVLVSEAGENSKMKGPVFRTFRVTPGVKK